MSSLDGLAMLGQQRAKASRKPKGVTQQPGSARRTLPPRHPAPAREPVTSQPEDPAQSSDSTHATFDDAADAQTTRAGSTRVPTDATATERHGGGGMSTTPPVDLPLIRSTLYVDADLDTWLQTISSLGRSTSPRVDITRSAVVRFALERLRADMTTQEIFAALSSRAIDVTSRGGRKRI